MLRIWNSDYDTSGSMLQMSTPYQILMQDLDVLRDIENENRFYKVRDISDEPQSYWMFEIFKISMNVRSLAIGISTFMLFLACFVF